MKLNSEIKGWLLYGLTIVVSVAVLAEVFLRVTGKYQVFSEMNGQPFYSEYGQVNKTWFHTRQPNDSFVPAGTDFHYPYVTNRYGFRDKNYDTAKAKSVYRILVSGDSFAEGEGTPYDSTWPRILEKNLLEKGINAEVIDAGVAGSDILYDYMHYRELLKQLHPDLIIASLNSSDYNDVLVRGGLERFQKDGTTKLKSPPWYMPLYIHSRFVRALLHKFCGFNNTGLFVSYKDFVMTSESSNALFEDVFSRYKKEADTTSAAFVAVIHSTPTEIKFPAIDIIKTNTQSLNRLSLLLSNNGIRCFNLMGPLYNRFANMPVEQLSYPHDMHYTPIAYAYMGNLVADSLLANHIINRQP